MSNAQYLLTVQDAYQHVAFLQIFCQKDINTTASVKQFTHPHQDFQDLIAMQYKNDICIIAALLDIYISYVKLLDGNFDR